MTGRELRQKVADIMIGWAGGTKGGRQHIDILTTYNTHRPLARGYTVQTGDAYCATTVSAAWIRAGIAAYTGTECSVPKLIEIAKSKGTWVENDAHRPQVGDACVYDWQDTGRGDDTGSGDHIGIVTALYGESFVVTEGNMSGGKIGKRTVTVNSRYIRGFICPDYAAIAQALWPETKKEDDDMITLDQFKDLYRQMRRELQDNDAGTWSGEAREWAETKGIVQGASDADFNGMWEDVLTREQAVTLLYRFARYIGAE